MSRPPWVDGYKRAASAPAQRVEVVDQLFPTPPELAARMVKFANIKPGHRVLEPSAGTGSLVWAVQDTGTECSVLAVEVNHLLAHHLEAEAVRRCKLFPSPPTHTTVRCDDFLTLTEADLGTFDVCIANPPFKNGVDVQHVQHMIHFVKPGGRIVSLCAAGSRQQHALVPLASHIEWVEDAFRSVGTGVRVSLLVIDRVA